jgi:hypothetical protein
MRCLWKWFAAVFMVRLSYLAVLNLTALLWQLERNACRIPTTIDLSSDGKVRNKRNFNGFCMPQRQVVLLTGFVRQRFRILTSYCIEYFIWFRVHNLHIILRSFYVCCEAETELNIHNPVSKAYRFVTIVYQYDYHNSGHYPSSCLLFKTQLNSTLYVWPYLTRNTLRLHYEPNRSVLSIGLWRWYNNITITILYIIHRPVFLFKTQLYRSKK